MIHQVNDGESVCLPKGCYGQRYYLSEAQIAIAQTVPGLGDCDNSGEGFKELVADYFVHAAMLVPLLKGKKILLVHPLKRPTPTS